MKMPFMKNTEKKAAPVSNPTLEAPTDKPSIQKWIPFDDVYNYYVHRKDGYLLSYVQVQPVNITLLSKNEQRRKIQRLNEVLNGIDYDYQFLSIPRPADLDGYIAGLEAKKNKQQNTMKRRILNNNIVHASSMASNGEAMERQFYYILYIQEGKEIAKVEKQLYRRSFELANKLSSTAELPSHVCEEQECRNLLFLFLNPLQAAYERAPVGSGPYIHSIYDMEG
ncbi:hypothetical protein ABES02_29400 [Neobacillus pocheonensis]|uniref:hypothetical protein n=1 Tax=Neobacillus pocheonensis TaxID=363869 RepID=UPI003D2BE116